MIAIGTKIFVGGASGMAGRAIVAELLGLGAHVRAAYHAQENPFAGDPRVEAVRADLRDAEACRAAVRGCTLAVMAAATTGGAAEQQAEPWRQVNDNLIMNARLLEALHQENVRRVVLIGSATSYQEFDGAIREDQLDWAADPPEAYLGIGWVSRYLEKLAWFWHRKTGLEVAFIRAANIFGPFAKFDPAVSNFIPALIRKAVADTAPLEVWGSPDVTRDVIFSAHFASVATALLLGPDLKFEVFNVGTSRATTVGEVVRWIMEAINQPGREARYRSDRPATTRHRVLDCSKLRRHLPNLPAFEVEAGVRKTVAWWIRHQHTWLR